MSTLLYNLFNFVRIQHNCLIAKMGFVLNPSNSNINFFLHMPILNKKDYCVMPLLNKKYYCVMPLLNKKYYQLRVHSGLK